VIESLPNMDRCFVITNRGSRDEGRDFITAGRSRGVDTNALVFCGFKGNWEPMPDVTIDNRDLAVHNFLESYVLQRMRANRFAWGY
jgi:hypothetical protein